MASFFDELATYLDNENAGIIFTNDSGRNTFINELPPDDPDTCVAILGLPGTTVGQSRDVPGLKFPRIQIITRSKVFETADGLMTNVRDTLHGMIGVNLSSYRVLRCHAEQDGGPIGQDKQGRHEFSINLIAEYHAL